MSKIKQAMGLVCAAAVATSLAAGSALAAGGGGFVHEKQDWSFAGVFGYYDRAQLQRGFKVYQNNCAACHGMGLVHYRNLTEPGGPEFSEDEIKALIAENAIEVPGEPDEFGEPTTRPARLSDKIKGPYKNIAEARAANGGAYPPDFSVIAKARNAYQDTSFAPLKWATDIATGYQEGGADYIYALLTSYPEEVPEDIEVPDGMNYNPAYPGNFIAMAQPLWGDDIEYTDGTPTTVSQHAKDVSAFLMWAAEPKLEERKRLGVQVMIYLAILAVLLYLAKRHVWSRIEH